MLFSPRVGVVLMDNYRKTGGHIRMRMAVWPPCLHMPPQL